MSKTRSLITALAVAAIASGVETTRAQTAGTSRDDANSKAKPQDAASAQSVTPDDEDADVPVILVTASRLEESVRRAASSVTVLGAEDLDLGQHRRVLDALRYVPALDVTQTGYAGGTTTVFLRGANAEHTLVLVDGIDVNDPISPGRTFDFAHLTDDNIERIEIVRGPQSVLYGSDALGGVINIITKRGSGTPRVRVRTEGGSFGSYRVGGSVTGSSGNVHYTLGASHYGTDGISAADVDLGNLEKDGYRNTTVSSRVGYAPHAAFDVEAHGRYTTTRSDIDNGGGAQQDDPNNITEHEQWLVQVTPRLTLGGGRWEQKLGVAISEVSRKNDNGFDAEHPQDLIASSFDSRIIDLDWQHNVYAHRNNTVTFGLDAEEDRGESTFHSESAFGPFSSVFEQQSVRTWGFYAQDRVTLGEGFVGTAGLRADAHEEFGSHVTYRFAGAHRFARAGTKLRATVGSGFKAPSLFQLYSSFGDSGLDPEESVGWDVGVDQPLWRNRAMLGVTFFQNDFDNLIDFDGGTNQYNNIAKAKTQGIEFAARVRPRADVALQLSYTFTDSEDAQSKERLLRRATHKGGVQGSYRFVERGSVSLALLYVGTRDDNDFSTFPAARVRLDDYFLVNLGASYDVNPRLQIFGRIENVLDHDYEEARGFGVPGIAAYAGFRPTF